MKITFYKDNLIANAHQVPTSQIIKEYNATKESKLDMPFERKILHFMMITYGSYDKLTDIQWDEIYEEKTK